MQEANDWNSTVYHRVSGPQLEWGAGLLDTVALAPGQVIVDIGCGTGRVTGRLLERLPAARVVALDLSSAMISAAKAHLAQHARNVSFVQADAVALPFAHSVHVVFSTATFHWIRDHNRLFHSVFAALTPGGRLFAQCGGGPNLKHFIETCESVMRQPHFVHWFSNWRHPWEFSDVDTATGRLRDAGFVNVQASLFPGPVVQPDAAAYREFVEHVVCGPYLRQLPTSELRDQFLRELVDRAAGDRPAYMLDYWRLNLIAEKPAATATHGS